MGSPYVVRISSQKGGVGKTTVATNLSVVLKRLGYDVLLMDTDTTNPSVGFHMGMEDANIGFYELMMGKANINNTIHVHSASGVRVIPGTITSRPFIPSADRMRALKAQIGKLNYDFVIVDTPPGFFPEGSEDFYDEAVILSTPEMSSCVASIRLSHVYEKNHIKHVLVLNRVARKRYELSIKEIEEMYEDRVYGVLPEDEIVPRSIAEHIPAYLLSRRADFSREVFGFSKNFSTRSEAKDGAVERGMGLWARILAFFRR